MEQNLLLDMGCGNNPKKINGYKTIGLDLKTDTMADVVCNLEYKLPFKSNSFDLILCFNVLEHIHNIIQILEEIYRIGKPGAVIQINAPHFSGMDTHQDITHVRGFGSRVFYPFTGKMEEVSHYAKCKFIQKKCFIDFWPITELGDIKIQKWIGAGFIANKFTSIYERFLCYMMPAQGIYFELEIDK